MEAAAEPCQEYSHMGGATNVTTKELTSWSRATPGTNWYCSDLLGNLLVSGAICWFQGFVGQRVANSRQLNCVPVVQCSKSEKSVL
jgi:hypothetical protein